MMYKRAILATCLLGGVLITGTPLNQVFNAPLTVYASEVSDFAEVSYDAVTSMITVVPKSGGTTYFSYKLNDNFPTYNKDKVCFFNADGSLLEEKTGMLGQSIFSDDTSTWIDASKQKKSMGDFAIETDYTQKMMQGDSVLVLPYSEPSQDNRFYIPAVEPDTKVTVSIVNVSADGVVSEITTTDFVYTGVVASETQKINATVQSVNKTGSSETVRISGDNVSYVKFGSETFTAKDNSVDIELTSNGEKRFTVYGQDADVPEVLTYTVEGLVGSVDKEIANEVVDSTAPVITSDALPTEQQDTAIKFKVYTDEKSVISCNGVSSEGTELEITIAGNGDYLVTATDEAGNYSEKTITFDCFTDIVGEYVLDRDNLWGEDETVNARLPQTGGVALAAVLGLGGALVGGGVYMTKKGNKKEDSNDVEN